MSNYIGGLPRAPIEMGSKATAFNSPWAGWFSNAQTILADVSNSGPTTARPTAQLYVGKFYFDTTLGLPVWLKTPGATPVWVNASGAAV